MIDSVFDSKRSIRVLALLDSLAQASISSVPLKVLHELAYLANILAPVFTLAPFSASLLKRQNGPYYPLLQDALEKLLGRGLVTASHINFVHVPEEGRYRLDARYNLNWAMAKPVIEAYRSAYRDTEEVIFLDELAIAYSTLSEDIFGRAADQDAKYADTDVDVNNVIDFGEWLTSEQSNFAANAALSFSPTVEIAPAERLYLYIDHIKRRAANGH